MWARKDGCKITVHGRLLMTIIVLNAVRLKIKTRLDIRNIWLKIQANNYLGHIKFVLITAENKMKDAKEVKKNSTGVGT